MFAGNLVSDIIFSEVPMSEPSLVPVERIERAILALRGHRVLLDADPANMHGVETKILVRAVKRNRERFPDDFMLQLSSFEFEDLRFQFGTSKSRGGRRYLPYAFTGQSVVMLSKADADMTAPSAILAPPGRTES